MKEIRITEIRMSEALAQIDTIEDLSSKDKGCLRLLTEEMFSMCMELLNVQTLDFDVKCDERQYVLCVRTKTRVNEEAKEQFLSVSSSGKNIANKGVKGMLGAVLEILSYEGNPSLYGTWGYGLGHMGGLHPMTWTLSQYIETASKDKTPLDWDGMEKSIIANFADDVSIGVRNRKLEIIVTKSFSNK